MALTPKQKQRILKHTGEIAFIGALIIVLWAVVSIAKSQGL